MNRKALADALHATGHDRFSDKSSTPKWNAQRNLEGRTHFADDDTLRYFGSRIISARDDCDGLLFVLIDSSYADYAKTSRVFRFAVFDVFGTCIHRPDIEHGCRTADAARKARDAWMATFDVDAHYADAIDGQAARLERDAAALRSCLAKGA